MTGDPEGCQSQKGLGEGPALPLLTHTERAPPAWGHTAPGATATAFPQPLLTSFSPSLSSAPGSDYGQHLGMSYHLGFHPELVCWAQGHQLRF